MQTLKMTETQLVKLVIEYLLRKGHFAWRNNTGAMSAKYTTAAGVTRQRYVQFSEKGAPDILGVQKGTGRMLAIECKIGRNKPTDEQVMFLNRCTIAGALAFVTYDLDTVIRNGL